jgi:prefoldin subunit 5
MVNIPEEDLGQKSILGMTDYVRVVGSDGVSYKQGLDDVSGKIITDYDETELGGVTQSVKSAIDTLDNSIDSLQDDNTQMNTRMDALQAAIGTPLVASTVSEMTDHDKVYVYVGSESGYTSGNWYYWNGTAWTSGGVYNSTAFVTDKTLTLSDKAADAKVTGDEINDLKSAFIPVLETTLDLSMILTQTGGLYDTGSDLASNNYKRSDFIPVNNGDVFSYKIKSGASAAITFYTSANKTSIQTSYTVDGGWSDVTGEFTAPSNGYIRVTSHIEALTSQYYFVLKSGIEKSIKDIKANVLEIEATDTAQTAKITRNTGICEELQQNVFSLLATKAENGFLGSDGSFTSNANYRTTGYIAIKNGQSFNYNIQHGTTLPIICFYTGISESTVLTSETVLGQSGYKTGTFTAPQDGYVRFTYLAITTGSYVDFTDKIPSNVKNYVDELIPPSNGVRYAKVLFLGDSIFDDEHIQDAFHTFSGAECFNGAFGGTRVSDRGGTDNFQYFDGVNLVDALCSTGADKWVDQDAAAAALESSYPWIPAHLAALKNVDMSEIDIIITDWGTNDYAGGVSKADILNAYTTVINTIQQAYPHIRILVSTPIWRYWTNPDMDSDTKVWNDATLKEIASDIENLMKDLRISVVNSYQNIPLSLATADTYFATGSTVHLNSDGATVYAHILNGKIQSIF